MPQWSLIRHASCSASVCNLHEVLGVDLARLREKLRFLVCRAVVCDVAHFPSTQQLEIGDELERVSQDLRFSVVGVCGGRRWQQRLSKESSEDEELSPISEKVTVATTFSNVHDVCKSFWPFPIVFGTQLQLQSNCNCNLNFNCSCVCVFDLWSDVVR